MDGWIALAAALVGFGLSEWSNRQAWRRQLDHRWDTDRLQRYAAYLAALDQLDDTARTIASIEEDLDDPGVVVANVWRIDRNHPDFDGRARMVVQLSKKNEGEARGRHDEVGRRLDQLESELEMMTTEVDHVFRVGLRLRVGDEEYREQRKKYVRRVQRQLQIASRPPRRVHSRPVRQWRRITSRRKNDAGEIKQPT